jgi:hypothetical protein
MFGLGAATRIYVAVGPTDMRNPACRAQSKALSQRRWQQTPENENCFRGPESCERASGTGANETRAIGAERHVQSNVTRSLPSARDSK